jgi:cytochrome c biogenesis protein CcmG, thiol:disulfide interchange protein DsbE
MKIWRLLLLPALALLLGALALGLRHDPKQIPSPLIGKPLPAIVGVTLDGQPVDLAKAGEGGPLLVNVWA